MPRPDGVPVIDLGALRGHPGSAEAERTVRAIGDACISVGFFYVSNHGIPLELQHRLERASRAFFAHPAEVKKEISMARAGSRWRGYFVRAHTRAAAPERASLAPSTRASSP